MSSPDDPKWLGEQVLRKSRTTGLRARMADFVDEHGDGQLKEIRDRGTSGKPLSEIVDEERDERV